MNDSFSTGDNLTVNGIDYTIFSLAKLGQCFDLSKMPFSMKILLENLLRCEDGVSVTKVSIEAIAQWNGKDEPKTEIAFMPACPASSILRRCAMLSSSLAGRRLTSIH